MARWIAAEEPKCSLSIPVAEQPTTRTKIRAKGKGQSRGKTVLRTGAGYGRIGLPRTPEGAAIRKSWGSATAAARISPVFRLTASELGSAEPLAIQESMRRRQKSASIASGDPTGGRRIGT
jgi:hypothetical protein